MRSEGAFRSFTHNFAQKRYFQAGQDIQTAVKQSPENAYYLSSQALLSAATTTLRFDPKKFLDHKLDFDEEDTARILSAINLYNRALELNPGDDSFHHNLGWLYCFLRQPEMAQVHFRKAIGTSGDLALYHVSLGLLHEWTNEQSKSASEYAKAIRLSPGMLDSEFFHELQKRLPQEAEQIVKENTKYFEEQREHGNDPLSNASLGKSYLYLGRIDDAITRLQEATEKLPSLSRPWKNLGQCYELIGNETEAKRSYEKSVFLDPSDYSTWARLGDLAYRQQRWTPAIDYYKRALNGWRNQSSSQAQRVFRVYRIKNIVPNDIVATKLLAYSAPSFDGSGACSKLAEMYRASGNQAAASYYDNLREEIEHGK